MRKVLTVCLVVCFLVPVFASANPATSTTGTGSPIPNGLAEKQLQERKAKLERSRALLGVLEETYQAYEKGNENNPAIMEELAQIRAAIPEANCDDESLFLRAQGKGRVLVEVFHRKQSVPVGGLDGKVTIKIMTVKEVYMNFHDQGGLIVPAGKHQVQVSMPGRETVKVWAFVPAGETLVVQVEIGPKLKVAKTPTSKKPEDCSTASISDTTRIVQKPIVGTDRKTVDIIPPVDCSDGDCYYLNLPAGTK